MRLKPTKGLELLSFIVPGKAEPGGSKRALPIRGKPGARPIVVDANPKVHAWRDRVASYAAKARVGMAVLDGPLRLEVTIRRLRPKGHYGKKGLNKKGRETPYPTTKPDTTKLLRAIEDALNGIVWRDDAQVVEQVARKVWGDQQEAEIRITPMEET